MLAEFLVVLQVLQHGKTPPARVQYTPPLARSSKNTAGAGEMYSPTGTGDWNTAGAGAGDLSLDVGADFLAVVEHRLVPAGVWCESAKLRAKGISCVRALAPQESSHVGSARVGVVSLRGAPLSPPTIAAAQFRSFFFFDLGRVARFLFPIGDGRFVRLVVLWGSWEQRGIWLNLKDCALSACACRWDVNVEPTKVPCLSKLGSWLIWRLLGLVSLVWLLQSLLSVPEILLAPVGGTLLLCALLQLLLWSTAMLTRKGGFSRIWQ